MDNDYVITITTDDSQVLEAAKSLNVLEKSANSLNTATTKLTGNWSQYANVVTAASVACKAIRTVIQDFIISPLVGAVNGFMAL